MSADLKPPVPERLSTPGRKVQPRQLDPTELASLRLLADALIPESGPYPAATAQPGFDDALTVALTARSDAFDDIIAWLGRTNELTPDTSTPLLRALHTEEPETFQALSAILAGAWLILPSVRADIGYPGQRRDAGAFDEAAVELSGDVLDPVLARGPIFRPAPD